MEKFLAIFLEALGAIREPRLFKTERGYQGALLVELRHQLRQQRTRPRPLSELFEAVVVDIDNAHRGRLIDPRFQPQELVENVEAEFDKGGRLTHPQNHRHEHDRQRH